MIHNSNPEEKAKIVSDNPRKVSNEQNHFVNFVKSAMIVLDKPYEHRTTSDAVKLSKLVEKVNFFKQMQILCSPELLKSLLKYGKMLKVSENNLICSKNDILEYFIVGLSGKFGMTERKNQNFNSPSEQQQSKHRNYLNSLKNFTPKHLFFLKKKQIFSTKCFKTTKIDPLNIDTKQIFVSSSQNQLIFTTQQTFQNVNQIKRHPRSIISLDAENYLFYIDFRKLCQIMREEYNKDIFKEMEIFLTFNCFKLFKKQKLKQMVQEIEKKKANKNQVLFKEGQNHDRRIFILTHGEISLQKSAALGKQNPNTLYKNRLSIKRSQYKYKGKQTIQVIPYADFSKVYNACTDPKRIKLTTVSPISILGDEQVICKTQRKSTAIVTSFNAQLYVFTVEQISKYLIKDSNIQIEDFLKTLQEQITDKKILYRQQKLGTQVQNLNKNLKNGFYIEQHSPPVVNRKSITKLNKTISCIKPQFTEPNDTIADQKDHFLTASFTTHNFQQFFQQKKTMKSNNTAKLQVKNQKVRSQRAQFSEQQRNVMKLLHGNQGTYLRPSNSQRVSISQNKISAFAIDIQRPFFTPQYFKKQMRQNRRIQLSVKRAKLQSLYSSTLSMKNSRNKSRTLSSSRNRDNSISTVRKNF